MELLLYQNIHKLLEYLQKSQLGSQKKLGL